MNYLEVVRLRDAILRRSMLGDSDLDPTPAPEHTDEDHADAFAALIHAHDYSPTGHEHPYAPAEHDADHSDAFAPLSHAHSDLASSGHDHASAYVPLARLNSPVRSVSGDWNNFTESGFYRGTGLANSAPGSHSWQYTLVINHSATYCVQVAINYNNGTDLYQRRMHAGNWQPWTPVLASFSGTLKGYEEQIVDLGNVSGTVTLDLTTGNVWRINPTAATTIAFTGMPAAGTISPVTLIVANSTYSLTWPAGTKFSTGTAPELVAETWISMVAQSTHVTVGVAWSEVAV